MGPGASGAAPTSRTTTPTGGTDLVAPVLGGVVIAFVLVLVAGLAISARRLNRGDPLLPGTEAPPPAEGPRAEAPPDQPRPDEP